MSKIYYASNHVFTSRNSSETGDDEVHLRAGLGETLVIDNLKVNNLIIDIPHYFVEARTPSSQTVASGSLVKVNGYFDNLLSSSGITRTGGDYEVPSSGIYQISYSIIWGNDVLDKERIAFLTFNDVTNRRILFSWKQPSDNGQIGNNASGSFYLEASDTVQLYCVQDSGNPLDLVTSTNNYGYFSITKIC